MMEIGVKMGAAPAAAVEPECAARVSTRSLSPSSPTLRTSAIGHLAYNRRANALSRLPISECASPPRG
jgi:hypothetical protein